MAEPIRTTYDQRVLRTAWEHLEQSAVDGAEGNEEKTVAVQEALKMFEGILWPKEETIETEHV